MKNLRVIVSSLMLLASTTQSHAGIFGRTVHSRANCLNNESITWWRNHYDTWRVISVHHSPFGQQHAIDTGWQYTWRAHAIHWGEGDPKNLWTVYGFHYQYSYSKTEPFAHTESVFCSAIDGWL